MNPEERDRLVQEFVDKALAHYGQAEPRTGLEARILARLADAHPVAKSGRQGWGTRWTAQWFGWRWAAIGAAVVVALTVGLGVYRMVHREVRPQATPVVRVNPATPTPGTRAPEATQVQSAKLSPQGTRTTRKTRRNTARIERARSPQPATADLPPRLAQFPAPAPLSEQERLLLSYLQRTPREEIVAVVKENEEFQRRLREAEEMRTPAQ